MIQKYNELNIEMAACPFGIKMSETNKLRKWGNSSTVEKKASAEIFKKQI